MDIKIKIRILIITVIAISWVILMIRQHKEIRKFYPRKNNKTIKN